MNNFNIILSIFIKKKIDTYVSYYTYTKLISESRRIFVIFLFSAVIICHWFNYVCVRINLKRSEINFNPRNIQFWQIHK